MFGFGKRAAIENMSTCCQAITMGMYKQFLTKGADKTTGQSPSDTVIAAAVNQLLGYPASPQHTAADLSHGQRLAAFLVKNDPQILRAAVLCCRTRLTIAGLKHDTDGAGHIIMATQWIGQYAALPVEEPDPTNMSQIAQYYFENWIKQ